MCTVSAANKYHYSRTAAVQAAYVVADQQRPSSQTLSFIRFLIILAFAYFIARPSVCLSYVVTQAIEMFGTVSSFYAIWYLGHLWPFDKNFTEIVLGEPLRLGVKHKGVAEYSDFGPITRYISETVQDRS